MLLFHTRTKLKKLSCPQLLSVSPLLYFPLFFRCRRVAAAAVVGVVVAAAAFDRRIAKAEWDRLEFVSFPSVRSLARPLLASRVISRPFFRLLFSVFFFRSDTQTPVHSAAVATIPTLRMERKMRTLDGGGFGRG